MLWQKKKHSALIAPEYDASQEENLVILSAEKAPAAIPKTIWMVWLDDPMPFSLRHQPATLGQPRSSAASGDAKHAVAVAARSTVYFRRSNFGVESSRWRSKSITMSISICARRKPTSSFISSCMRATATRFGFNLRIGLYNRTSLLGEMMLAPSRLALPSGADKARGTCAA